MTGQLQLYIELEHIKPKIWRRMLVPDTITLVQLHRVIQVVMGWTDSHLHEFEIAGGIYGMVDSDWPDYDVNDERRKRLTKLLEHKLGHNKTFTYLYDLGDSWLHRLTLEEIQPVSDLQRHAICVDGENASPPEDVGGPPGYVNFIDAILNPRHEAHEDMLEWYGESFDPSHFDLNQTNQALKQITL